MVVVQRYTVALKAVGRGFNTSCCKSSIMKSYFHKSSVFSEIETESEKLYCAPQGNKQ